jgi:alkyl hydroperoxide reductase subunit AhpC
MLQRIKVIKPQLNLRQFSASISQLHHIARVQKPAPEWTATAVINKQFVQMSQKDFLGKWLVLFFYPMDFTFVCPSEIIAFSERSSEFEKLGAKVVGVSVDSQHSHLAWINTPRRDGGLGEMKIPLVADLKKELSEKFGVLLDDGIAARGTFIIDTKGTVRQISINDLSVGRSVDETLRLLEGFQFADEHGEVCPINWKKGDKTIKPDPVQSKEYFKAVN